MMPTETLKLTPEESALISRLADLMEQGAVGKRQITGQYFEIDGNGVCAMGAILSAVGVKPQPSESIKVNKELDVQTWPRIALDNIADSDKVFAGYKGTAPLPDVIIHLNDMVGWDFAHIVMWLRQIASAS